MAERNRLKKKFNGSRNQSDWESYRLERNKVVSMRRKSIRKHFEKVCLEKYADQKKFWCAIKPYVNSRKNVNNSGVTILKEGDKIIRNPQEMAETLNEFFTSSTESTKELNQNDHPADLSHISNNLTNRPNVSISNTNPTEVYEVMRNLKPNKATGCDGIPPRAVKESMEVLCYPLSTLMNHVLTSTKIPQQWKLGEVTPVIKKDCSLLKTNYRPVTILPAFSKVFKRLVHHRISPHFEGIYHKYVFAYRKYHGCDTALLSLTEQGKKEIDDNKTIGLVSMDLSKAFDTLPHELIILKLKEYGADEATTALIRDYLSNRFQRVRLGDTLSNWQSISKGVPQGSILGPLLFNIFMNDLSYVIKKSTLSTYADDTQIFYADNELPRVEKTINTDLASADKWFAQNGMKRNSSKYQAMVLGKNKGAELAFKCDESQILISKTMELLGVTIDDKLNFENHIAKICRKVSQQIAVLKRMQKLLPFETRGTFTRLSYCRTLITVPKRGTFVVRSQLTS